MRGLKRVFIFLGVGFIFYGAGMIIIRLKMTETAYQFEEAKSYERTLREEQQRLRLKISESSGPDRMRLKNFQEPHPSQVTRIPQLESKR